MWFVLWSRNVDEQRNNPNKWTKLKVFNSSQNDNEIWVILTSIYFNNDIPKSERKKIIYGNF